MHNEELHNLYEYSSKSVLRMVNFRRMYRACNTQGEKRNEYRIWVRNGRKETSSKASKQMTLYC
jgi:hypothetical protein